MVCPSIEYPTKFYKIQLKTLFDFSVWNFFKYYSSLRSMCLYTFFAIAFGCFMILSDSMSGIDTTETKTAYRISG